MPDHTDQLFVIDRNEKLIGVLPINVLLVNDPDAKVSVMMSKKMTKLHPNDKAQQATHAFERYNLVTAPVVDTDDKLLGRVTVNEVMDFIREESENEALNLAGLREEEDHGRPRRGAAAAATRQAGISFPRDFRVQVQRSDLLEFLDFYRFGCPG